MKYIIIVGDGMSDRPLKNLNGKTPLEAADTPNMDYLAEKGNCGMVNHFYKGLPLDSGVANLSILGYDPKEYYPGRGPLEAVNIGVDLEPGDIAMRFNFITIEEGMLKDPFAGHITNEETRSLVELLNSELGEDGLEFYQGISYRNLLVIRKDLDYIPDINCTQPHDIQEKRCADYLIESSSKKGNPLRDLLNDWMIRSIDLLEGHEVNQNRINNKKHPGNMIWFWGAGIKPEIPLFQERYGLKGSLISAVDLLKGIGKEIDLNVINVPGATGYLDTNYEGKADKAIESLIDGDFVFVHIESTDEAGHEGSIENKIKAIEDLDKRVVGRIIKGLKDDYCIALTADHSTPIEIKTHSDEEVPFVIFDSTESKKDDVKHYSEIEIGSKGSLGSVRGYDFMNLLLKHS